MDLPPDKELSKIKDKLSNNSPKNIISRLVEPIKNATNVVTIATRTIVKLNIINDMGKTPVKSDQNIKPPVLNILKPSTENKCIDCSKVISRRAKRCDPCQKKTRRKCERPDKKTLLEEIKILGYEAVGRKYGVTGNAIRKW